MSLSELSGFEQLNSIPLSDFGKSNELSIVPSISTVNVPSIVPTQSISTINVPSISTINVPSVNIPSAEINVPSVNIPSAGINVQSGDFSISSTEKNVSSVEINTPNILTTQLPDMSSTNINVPYSIISKDIKIKHYSKKAYIFVALGMIILMIIFIGIVWYMNKNGKGIFKDYTPSPKDNNLINVNALTDPEKLPEPLTSEQKTIINNVLNKALIEISNPTALNKSLGYGNFQPSKKVCSGNFQPLSSYDPTQLDANGCPKSA